MEQGAIFDARFIHDLIAFARYLADHEATNAPQGAFFNAYAFLKTGTMVCARAIQLVIPFTGNSIFHRPPFQPLYCYGYAYRRFWHQRMDRP
jgi:hypothetical protein